MTTGRGTGFALQSDRWLSEIVGRPAYRLLSTATPADDWTARIKAENLFVTAKLPAQDVAAANELEGLGFRMVDTILTFEAAKIAGSPPRTGVRFARGDDRDAVTRIAGKSFVYSRFHLDPNIPKSIANKVKASWAANYFEGKRGDGMVVAEHDGAVVGFLLLLWAASMLVVDLIAVVPQAKRRGMASAMIKFAAAHGTGGTQRLAGLRGGTQAANVASVRLYESLGLRLAEAQFVMHHHGRGGPYNAGALS